MPPGDRLASTRFVQESLSMQKLLPLMNKMRRVARLRVPDLTEQAVDRWEIHPAEELEIPPAICLPNQVERITRTEFAPKDMVVRSLSGARSEHVAATMAFRLRDVDFVDGVIYGRGGAEMHLRARKNRSVSIARPSRSISGALFETWVGNRWFGNWLLDDCLSYRLAEDAGNPLTSMPERGGHVPRYEALLDMRAERIGDVHFDDLVIFDDHHNNTGRLARAQDMRARLLKGRDPTPNPGVFLVRGDTGDARRLENEMDLAEGLEKHYGFRIMFPEDHSVDELLDACGATQVVAGIEGSQLNHGMTVMPPGGTLLTLQPADRVTTAMKLLTDRWQQRFAVVVGTGTAENFRIDWDELRRTTDMIL